MSIELACRAGQAAAITPARPASATYADSCPTGMLRSVSPCFRSTCTRGGGGGDSDEKPYQGAHNGDVHRLVADLATQLTPGQALRA